MSRSMQLRLRRLEADRAGSGRQHVVFITGTGDGSANIAALIAQGDAHPQDDFVVIRTVYEDAQ